jgi:hypothetical protein
MHEVQTRLAKFPDNAGAAVSATCLEDACGWKVSETGDVARAEAEVLAHAEETKHAYYHRSLQGLQTIAPTELEGAWESYVAERLARLANEDLAAD